MISPGVMPGVNSLRAGQDHRSPVGAGLKPGVPLLSDPSSSLPGEDQCTGVVLTAAQREVAGCAGAPPAAAGRAAQQTLICR